MAEQGVKCITTRRVTQETLSVVKEAYSDGTMSTECWSPEGLLVCKSMTAAAGAEPKQEETKGE